MRQIYLDYAATTPIAPAVREAMLPFLGEHFGDPMSSHAPGRAAREAIEDARSKIADAIGADREEIVFTSGGTESNNLALKGVMMRHPPAIGGRLVISSLEHPSVAASARFLEQWGYDVTVAPSDSRGVVSPAVIEAALTPDTRLVSICHANHEIGAVQPLREIGELCRARGVLLHADASQSFGKVRVPVDDFQLDLLTISGHKTYAPKGVGVLFVRRGVVLEPQQHGAGHECGLRAGTENVAAIVGLGAAMHLAARTLDAAADRMGQLRDRLCHALRAAVGRGMVVLGREAPRLPSTLCVALPNVAGCDLLRRVPELCAWAGASCRSGDAAMSPTMRALGVPAVVAGGAIRLSVGWYTTEEEIDQAASLLLSAYDALA